MKHSDAPAPTLLAVGGQTLEVLDIPARQKHLPPLLLLHEGLGCVAMWRDFPARLAASTGCRVVAWSRAGYGASLLSAAPRTIDYMHREAREALPALIAALGIARPVLIGHSDGGSIALIFAGSFPQDPLGMAVMAPHEFVEAITLRGIEKARAAWFAGELPKRLARYHGAQTERVFFDWNDTWLSPAFAHWNIEEYLPPIACPVLAIQGEDDEYATMRQIEVIGEQVAGSRLLKLASCGHSPHRDQPAAVLDALTDFVGRLKA